MEETINYRELYEKLLIENDELKKKLKTYTAPKRSKTFYENHKEEIIQKVKEYRKKTGYINYSTPEQRKEYNIKDNKVHPDIDSCLEFIKEHLPEFYTDKTINYSNYMKEIIARQGEDFDMNSISKSHNIFYGFYT